MSEGADALAGDSPSVLSAAAFAESSPETTRTRTLIWQDPAPTAGIGAGMAGLEYMRALVAGELPPPPIAVLMQMAGTIATR